ncbi:hypothetical protein [Pedobacter sp. Leaf250]|uniref:hypothetical protein n=1 Tax=Pedobacter sp. Leaf250 TaxID=2876559 RepID=UPI001E4602EF|nr:hypothetical protein [Pedobacter sp. Leaf250]
MSIDNSKKVSDEQIIKYLAKGFTQPDISEKLKSLGIKPNSLSYIEKTLNRIRTRYKANTMFHLALILSKSQPSKF